MERDYVTIKSFKDSRMAYYLKFKLKLEGINSFIYKGNTQNLETGLLKVQVVQNQVEKAVEILCKLEEKTDSRSIDEKLKSLNRILLPIDFSENAKKAALFAFNLAASIKAEIKIVYVYNDPFVIDSFLGSRTSYEDFSNNVLYEVERIAKQNLIEFMEDLKHQLEEYNLSNVRYHYCLKKGKAEYQIIHLCEEYKPNVVIMGTKGVGKLPNDLIGSVALKVIENTKVPVLAIPEDWTFKNLKKLNLLYATDFLDSDFSAFNKLIEILKPFSVKLDCMHIETDNSEPWEEMQMFKLETYLNKNYNQDISCHLIKHKDILEGIQEYVDKNNIDMISFSSPKHGIFYKILKPNNLKKMLFYSKIPLLIFHADIKR